MRLLSYTLLIIALTWPLAGLAVPVTVFVDADAPDDGDGLTWATAFNSLQDALIFVSAGTDIWVAAGTYHPGNDRTDHFTLINGVALRGGFAGHESSPEERTDFRPGGANETILSGDIGRDQLGACFPNPFNPQTTIAFTMAAPGPVTLRIYDVKGRQVRTLARDEVLPAGRHERLWKGRDDGGRDLASGTYMLRMETTGLLATRSMVMVK